MVNASQGCSENWRNLIAKGKVQVNLKRNHFKKKKNTAEAAKIWFDDVDEILIEGSKLKSSDSNKHLPSKSDSSKANKRLRKDSVTEPTKKKRLLDEMENKQLDDEFKEVKHKNERKKLLKNEIIINLTDSISNNNISLESSRLTKAVGLDCEMVGTGYSGSDNMLARVSMVNQFGQTLYDKYVLPREKVTDYRTAVSGITPNLIKNGEDFLVVQKEVSDILKDRMLVGHAVHHDLKVLYLSHPRSAIRDTSKFKPFRKIFSGATPSLKKLAKHILNVNIQDGQHNSVEDAKAAMSIYMLHRKKWESSLKRKTLKQ